MSLSYTYDGSSLGYDIPPTKATLASRAELGSISMGGVSPEDPTAALNLTGWRPFYVEESDCSQTRLFTGWVADRHIGRSFEQTQFVGADSRIHDANICDLNAALSMRIIWDTDGNRPAEYLSDRVAWLLGSSYLTGLLDDTGKVHDFGATDMMDATDYRDQFPDAVLGDCNDRTGGVLNFFAFWDPTPASGSPRAALFFDTLDAATYDCTISISNAGDDNGTTIFEPDHPARLQTTPEAVYSDVIVKYKNGSVYRTLPSTATAHIQRGTTISRPFTSRESTATAQADRWLLAHANEVDRITTTIHVPSSVVGLIQAGQRMYVRFSHMPEYETSVPMRIVACSPVAVDDLADWYDVALELVAPRVIANACSFVPPPDHTGFSSLDVFGADIQRTGGPPAVSSLLGYTPAASVHATTSGITAVGEIYLFGTPNDGALWGITEFFLSPVPQTIAAWWQWDLSDIGTPSICAVVIWPWTYGMRTPVLGLHGSNDGTSWTTVADDATIQANWAAMNSTGLVVPIGVSVTYQYWRLTCDLTVPTDTNFDWVNMSSVMLWGGSVSG